MSETYDEMKTRIKPEQYVVRRRESGVARMSRGLGATRVEWEEPAVWATISRAWTSTPLVRDIHLNSLTLAIPEGPSGRWPRGVNATDEELILACVGDESVF
jgi:hypothetical protein